MGFQTRGGVPDIGMWFLTQGQGSRLWGGIPDMWKGFQTRNGLPDIGMGFQTWGLGYGHGDEVPDKGMGFLPTGWSS